mmetsp:Transcript_35958/g.57798  ORF Transcript_35958/g.57798 Transcript_35958/m.57798 type:complete len:82 (+) Transcript_35958:633-878(+)
MQSNVKPIETMENDHGAAAALERMLDAERFNELARTMMSRLSRDWKVERQIAEQMKAHKMIEHTATMHTKMNMAMVASSIG